jgi:hypothetical protein
MYRRVGHPLSPLLRPAEPPERERGGAGERGGDSQGDRGERKGEEK